MRKFIFGLIIIIILILGIVIGSAMNTTKNDLLEENKVIFEEEIIKENNTYAPKQYQIEGNTTTKIANKIDDTISNLFEKLFKGIANMLTE